MSAASELLAANERYAASFTKGDLPRPPRRRLAVVTCMDARLDPARFLGLEEGDAHVIRNAGGLVTDDALRSLVISHRLLGTQEVFVIAHTDCGMLSFTNEQLHAKLRDEAGTELPPLDFRPFPDLEESVRRSVRAVRESPFLPASFTPSGWIYDVSNGRLSEVV